MVLVPSRMSWRPQSLPGRPQENLDPKEFFLFRPFCSHEKLGKRGHTPTEPRMSVEGQHYSPRRPGIGEVPFTTELTLSHASLGTVPLTPWIGMVLFTNGQQFPNATGKGILLAIAQGAPRRGGTKFAPQHNVYQRPQ